VTQRQNAGVTLRETGEDLGAVMIGEREHLIRRAAELKAECGCKASTYSLSLCAVVLGVRQACGVAGALWSWTGLGWILAAAVVGKLLGIGVARLRLRRVERNLFETKGR
jgi:hypothetical protein